MKLAAAELERRLSRPAALPRAILLHGDDAARVAQLRDAVVGAIAGPSGEADMRIDRLAASTLRGSPGLVETALRAQGFFPGVRVVVVGEATDAQAEGIVSALEFVGPEAVLVATAGSLSDRSALRRAFEDARAGAAVLCSGGPVEAAEIAALLAQWGIPEIDPPAMTELVRLSGDLDRLSLGQLVAKVALWHRGVSGPLRVEGIVACAGQDGAADTDHLVLAVLRRDTSALARALPAHMPGGSGGVGTLIALQRVLRQILEVRLTMDDDGKSAAAALGRVFPPLSAHMQDALTAVVGTWSRMDLERLILTLHGLDARFRSDVREPERAVLERALLRFMVATPR